MRHALHRRAAASSGSGLGGGQVQDVRPRRRCAAATSITRRSRPRLGLGRPGPQEVAVVSAGHRARRRDAGRRPRRARAAGRPTPAICRTALLQPGGVQRRELGHAGVDEEALEAERARPSCSGRGSLPRYRAPHHPRSRRRPGTGRARRRAWPRRRRDSHRRRQAVERHVDDRGDAAGRGGPGRGREALPVGPARLVDVHVRVDQARAAAPRPRPARRPGRRGRRPVP